MFLVEQVIREAPEAVCVWQDIAAGEVNEVNIQRNFGGVTNPLGRFARRGYTLIALQISLPQAESHTCYHM